MCIPWGQGAVGSDVAFGFRRTTTVTGMLPIRIIETEREDFDGPVVELHISNPNAREPWRHTSVIAPVSTGSIMGFGKHGYDLAVRAVAAKIAA